MKVALLVASALVGLATAQYAGVPDCAKQCVNDILPKSCGTDTVCICTYPNFITDISCCISKSTCSQADIESALNTARSICTGTNVVLPSAAGCSGAASGSASGSSTPSATSAGAGQSSTASPSPTTNPGAKFGVNGMGLAGAVFGAVALL